MNLENQVISFTPSRPPTAEFLAHRRGQRGETAHVGGQREGRRGEDLFYGKEGLRWKGNQGKGKGKGKGKGEGKGKGSDKGKEGRDARSLETVREEEEGAPPGLPLDTYYSWATAGGCPPWATGSAGLLWL